MSEGLTAYDFVQQVYYAQEKVILDFWPGDDKFKEVLFEANLILQELQNAEDWTWLREQVVLGPCYHVPNEIPEFQLPDWVYKPSTLYHDGLKLHPIRHGHRWGTNGYDEAHYIDVPFASAGNNRNIRNRVHEGHGTVNAPGLKLQAIKMGNLITFNRPPLPHEERCVAVLDVQKRIEKFHVCNEECEIITEVEERAKDGQWIVRPINPVCASQCEIETKRSADGVKHIVAVRPKLYLTEIPDPNYVVMATAARHAEGSPPALARVASLNDAALKILSAMRQNDAASTESDYADWEPLGFVEVI